MTDTECIYIGKKHHDAALKAVAEQKSRKKKGCKVSLRQLVEDSLEMNPDFNKFFKEKGQKK